MKKTLIIKMLRDLRQNTVQFAAIFVMCFFAMFVFAGLNGMAQGEYEGVDRYFNETNFTDLVLNADNFTEGDKTEVEALKPVEHASRKAYITGKVIFPDEEKKIGMAFIEENVVSRLFMKEGEPYEPGKKGIWIDWHFAEKQHLAVGDTINLKYKDITFSEKIVGIIDSPDFLYYMVDETFTEPQYGEYCYAYMDASEYPGKDIRFEAMNVKLSTVSTQMMISDEDKNCLDEAKAEIMSVLSKNSLSVTLKEDNINYSDISGDIDSNRTMGFTFSGLFILVAVLGVLTTMSRMMSRQRTLIGALKALGFSRRTIMAHYVSYIFLIAAVGCVVGSFVGFNTMGKDFSDDLNDYYSSPYNGMVVTPLIIIVNISVVVFASATAYFSCRKLLVQNASEILRPEPPSQVGASLLERTPLWPRLSFATRWNYRDINRNRIRTVMGIFGVMLCSALLTTAFAYYEDLGRGGNWEYGELTPANCLITFSSEAGYGTVYDYAKKYNGQMVMSLEAEMKSRTYQRMYQLTVTGPGNLYRIEDEKFNFMEIPSRGAAMSVKAAEVLGVSVGDVIRFKIPGQKRWVRVRIVSLYKSNGTQGIVMSKRGFMELDQTFDPKLVYTNMTVPESLTELKTVAAVTPKTKSLAGIMKANAAVYDVVYIITAVAVVVGIVVTYNMGVMSFLEKVREIATLKVLGFPTPKIRWILQQQNLAITGIGSLLGLPIGVEMFKVLLDIPGETKDYVVILTVRPFLAAVALTFVLSVIVNIFLTAKVKNIDMVEALKGVE